jgi:FMN phosphatase YigB (HAD superfamily)
VAHTPSVRAVTFDFGQTLAELDTDMLARRLGERGVAADPARLEASIGDAVRAYSAAIAAGHGGHPWTLLMSHLLERAGVERSAIDPSVAWLLSEQPSRNLWRRPIPGMIELVRELAAARVPVGVVSNSEGGLADLADELGWTEWLGPIADSGRLGIEKPDRAIFAWTAERIGVPLDAIAHVGDAFAADVEGALGAGMTAIWFRGDPSALAKLGPRAHVCEGAAEVRAKLVDLGVLPTRAH